MEKRASTLYSVDVVDQPINAPREGSTAPGKIDQDVIVRNSPSVLRKDKWIKTEVSASTPPTPGPPRFNGNYPGI